MRRLLGRLGIDEAAMRFEASGGVISSAKRLLVPQFGDGGRPAPIDYLDLFLTVEEYVPLKTLPEDSDPPAAVVREIISSYDRQELLAYLAWLNRLCDMPEAWPGLTGYYRHALGRLGSGLDAAISKPGPGMGTRIVARQPVLAAMRELLREPLEDGTKREQPTLATAILLTHAVGSSLEAASEDDGQMLGRYPAHQLLNLARNAALYEEDDSGAAIVRTWRLWRYYGARLKRVKLRADPAELLREATALEVEDLMALGFAAYAQATQWEIDKPIRMGPDLGGVRVPPERLDAFLRVTASTPEELCGEFANHTTLYDFLPFQTKPILRTDDGLLVLDHRYLLDRITKGLFWIVHDYEKFTRNDEEARGRWNEAHGEMLELMVEDQLRSIAPGWLGARDRTFYTEEDFGAAYKGKVSDAGVDYGHHFVIFEVVGGQLSIGTRIHGEIDAFRSDTNRLVVSKCRQLDATSRAVSKDSRMLTGRDPVAGMKVIPALVVAGGYPSDALTRSYVEELVHKKSLLTGCMTEKLAIINLAEVEMLEGLAERGHDPAKLLTDWRNSGLRYSSLWNHLSREFKDHGKLRPTRLQRQITEILNDLADRVRAR